MNSLVLIGSGCLVCLMPLAIYLLFLAYLNQRGRPTMVSGPWDYASLLLGLSGFILIGGPVLLSTLDAAWRAYWFGGNFNRVQAVWHTNSVIWSTIAAGYVAGLAGIVGTFMYLRRKVTVVYNVDTTTLESMLVGALDRLGLSWRRVAGGYDVGGRKRRPAILDDDGAAAAKAPAEVPPAPENLSGLTAFVQIDTFPSLGHATIRWEGYDPLLRREVESELAKVFAATESPHNPAGGWFMTAAVALFFVMLMWMAFLIYHMMTGPKQV